MSRQIVVTLPEWTEIKGINNKQFADLLPTYDELLNFIKNGTPIEQEPKTGYWIKEETIHGWDGCSYQCSECGRSIHLDTVMEDLTDYPYCHCGARMSEV